MFFFFFFNEKNNLLLFICDASVGKCLSISTGSFLLFFAFQIYSIHFDFKYQMVFNFHKKFSFISKVDRNRDDLLKMFDGI